MTYVSYGITSGSSLEVSGGGSLDRRVRRSMMQWLQNGRLVVAMETPQLLWLANGKAPVPLAVVWMQEGTGQQTNKIIGGG